MHDVELHFKAQTPKHLPAAFGAVLKVWAGPVRPASGFGFFGGFRGFYRVLWGLGCQGLGFRLSFRV